MVLNLSNNDKLLLCLCSSLMNELALNIHEKFVLLRQENDREHLECMMILEMLE